MKTNTLLPNVAPTVPRRKPPLAGWLVALLLLLLAGPAAFAQLAGTYTINKNLPTSGTNFASFTDAATALNTSGISASVRINVLNGPYNEQFALNAVTGVSAIDTIVVDGGSSKQTLTYTGVVAQPAAVLLNGTDYVTLQNLTVDVSASATYGIGVHLVAQADNNRVANCVIMGSAAATSSTANAGIVASGTLVSAITAGNANKLRIENNVISGGYYGVIVTGASTTARNTGLRVTGNEIRDFYSYGLDVENQSGARLLANNIHRATRTASISTFYGIYLSGDLSTAVERNRVHDTFTGNPASTSIAYGVYYTTNDATAGNENDVVNNLIYNFNGSGTEYGIYNVGSDYARYYYNTVSLDNQAATGTTQTTYGFYQSTLATGIDFRNNIVSVTRTGGTGSKYALDFVTATSSIVSNYNNLYVGTGATYFTGRYGTTDYATLTNWRTANTNVYDQSSLQAAPQFVAPATGNLRPTASGLDGAATPLTRVPADFANALRSATAPDMGAFEFTPPAADVALVSIDAPTAPVSAGVRTVTVTIRNNGADPLTSVRLEYVLNGAAAVSQNFTLATPLASAATTALSFTTQGTLVTGGNTLTVTASLPNGQVDSNPANNSQAVALYTAIAGTFTINKNLPTGGTNFASFTDAALALNAGITGPVRINVLNGPYDEQFSLGIIAGVSATDTIVVDGGASKQTLTYTATSAQPAAVLLNGTDYVTLRNLTIDVSGGATYGIGVHLVAQADNNRVANCVIMGPAAATSSTANAGIVASGTLVSAITAGNANNLRIENNVISGGYYGVIVTGASTTARNTGLRVTGNEIRDFYYYGLDVENQSGARLLANNIHRSTRTGVSTFYGIYLAGQIGMAVEGNRIHDSFTGNTASTSVGYGIYMTTSDATAGNENDVVNNLIYNFNGAGTEYGIYNIGSDFIRYYHNTVSLDNQAFTGSTLSYGFYQTTLATGLDFRNNIVSVTRTGTGNRFALYYLTTTSVITSNYNDLYVGTGATYFTGRYGTVNYATLADWRAANTNAYDQNSQQETPRFSSAATGDLLPTAVAINGTGTTALLARVPRDFANVLRSTTAPDMGALEFAPMADDVAVVSIDSPTSPATPLVNPVTVTIRNGGTAVLASVTLSYVLNAGTPVTQTFTGLTLASAATQQLTFTQGVVAPSGSNTLAVTGSLPNGQPDGNANNNTQTITFTQPTPANDEPCSALALGGGPLASSNSGSSTSVQAGINTPSCVGGPLPKDVWFTFTPSGTSTTITLTGAAAGGLRIFSSASCSAGPFNEVFCQGSATSTTQVIPVPNLVAGTRYYVSVSGYSSADATGPFTIAATALLGTRAQTTGTALTVFPNPSATGSITLQMARPLGVGTVELLNALGQVVQRQPLAATAAQTLPTAGLAAGLYTLRVQAGGEVLTRKVVLQ